jgi:hypothetical protein
MSATTPHVLYLEGHAGGDKEDYADLLDGVGCSSVELVGFGRDGIHTRQRTRRLYRCEIGG